LIDIAGKDNFRMFAGTRYDRLDLMWGQVLSFINDKKDFGQRPPPDESQRSNRDFLSSDQIVDFLQHFRIVGILFLNEPDVVPYRCKDRKSTRLNSSHVKIWYAVFCWKKKRRNRNTDL